MAKLPGKLRKAEAMCKSCGAVMTPDHSKAHENKILGNIRSLSKAIEPLSKPPVSEAQRKAMGAAASGNSTLDIPKSVGKEFIDADKGGKLPETKKSEDPSKVPARRLGRRTGTCEFCGHPNKEIVGHMKADENQRICEDCAEHPKLKSHIVRDTKKAELEKAAMLPQHKVQMASQMSHAASMAKPTGTKLPAANLKLPSPQEHAARADSYADFMPKPVQSSFTRPPTSARPKLGKSEGYGQCALCNKPEHTGTCK